MKRVVILGSTGSVGESAVSVAKVLRGRVRVVGVVGNTKLARLGEQARELGCSFAATGTGSAAELQKMLPPGCAAYSGMNEICELVSGDDVDLVLCSIVGIWSLPAVLAAIESGKQIALATKEILVMAGSIVMAAAKRKKIRILPVDSEHSAVFQCLEGRRGGTFSKLILTCSGGPFRTYPAEKLKNVTWESAMRHPTWSMGEKVTIDSATLMNKALEVIEAHHLFGADADRIGVLVHPQSLVHSMVEFEDGSVSAQLSLPDMRFPVQYAFTWPDRCDGGLGRLDLAKAGKLSFEEVDSSRFPSLGFAYEAIRRGGTSGAVLNAADDVAVRRFKRGEIDFPGIWRVVEKTMSAVDPGGTEDSVSLGTIMEADTRARAFASAI